MIIELHINPRFFLSVKTDTLLQQLALRILSGAGGKLQRKRGCLIYQQIYWKFVCIKSSHLHFTFEYNGAVDFSQMTLALAYKSMDCFYLFLWKRLWLCKVWNEALIWLTLLIVRTKTFKLFMKGFGSPKVYFNWGKFSAKLIMCKRKAIDSL